MPFTLAHPAVLFPILKRSKYFSGTALIIGSMVPDVEFIAQMEKISTYSHSFPGALLFNIPVGLFLCWLFHAIIKYFLISNSPVFLQSRLQFIMEMDWLQYAKENKIVVFYSLLIGIASHLVWDAFTHDTGFFISILPSLKSNITFLNREMPIFHSLQIISSVLGLLAVAYLVWRLPKVQLSHHEISWNFWISFGLVILILSLVRFYLVDFRNGFWDVVIAFMGIAMYAIIINSFCHLLWLRKPRKSKP